MQRAVFVLVSVVLLASPLRAEEPAVAVVERVPFGDAVEIEGTFVPADALEVRVELDAFHGPLEVEFAAAEGPVAEGDVLVRFATREIDRQIESAELDTNLRRISLAAHQRGFEELAQRITVERTESKRRFERAKEDLRYFLEVEKPMRIEEAVHRLQGTRNRVVDQTEELRQLEKMYGEDELTEETEEIVLMRARRNLERAKQSLAFQEQRHERWLSTGLVREEQDRKLGFEKAELDYTRTRADLDDRAEKVRDELRKSVLDLESRQRRLDELRSDRERLSLQAPVSGVALAGAWSGGWKGRSEALERLEVGAELDPKLVKSGPTLMTVVPPGALFVETSVEEKHVLQVEAGLAAAVHPSADRSTTLRATVESVAPVGGSRYDVRLRLLDADARLRPGMTCKGEILVNTGEHALVVPAAAVEADGDRTLVHVVDEAGGETPVAIVPGAAKAGRVSVAKGLEAGQRVRVK